MGTGGFGHNFAATVSNPALPAGALHGGLLGNPDPCFCEEDALAAAERQAGAEDAAISRDCGCGSRAVSLSEFIEGIRAVLGNSKDTPAHSMQCLGELLM